MLNTEARASHGEQIARVGELDICYEIFGADEGPPLLLVMGLASQMVAWDDDFCARLAAHGFKVIRFDNRDIGRSTYLKGARVPKVRQLALRDKRCTAYSLDDMAGDAVGLLDVLGIPSAHVVGASMGGMIAQLIAINHPERVRSLVSIMSTTGNFRVGLPHPKLLPMLLRRPGRSREQYIETFVTTFRAIGSRRYPQSREELGVLAARCYDRGYNPAGGARQLAAIQTSGDRTGRLHAVRVPTTVIHGRQDQLVAPSGGRATARAIPGAKLILLEGMAHDLPRPVWPELIGAIVANTGVRTSAT